MLNKEFELYFDKVCNMLQESLHSENYAKHVAVKNYFRIKNSFYGGEELKEVVKEIITSSENLLTESMLPNQIERIDEPVRKLVRDIVNIVKSQKYGYYMLPEDMDSNQFEYDFDEDYRKLGISRSYNIPSFSIEFQYNTDYTINEPYKLNGTLLTDGETITIILIINPKFYPQFMYDLIADLNDIITHEIEHLFQENFMRPDREIYLDDSNAEDVTPMEYYTQKHEVPAQIMGLKRIAKLRKQPIESVISDWFNRSKYINQLNDKEINYIVKYLTTEYEKKYGTI